MAASLRYSFGMRPGMQHCSGPASTSRASCSCQHAGSRGRQQVRYSRRVCHVHSQRLRVPQQLCCFQKSMPQRYQATKQAAPDQAVPGQALRQYLLQNSASSMCSRAWVSICTAKLLLSTRVMLAEPTHAQHVPHHLPAQHPCLTQAMPIQYQAAGSAVPHVLKITAGQGPALHIT